MNDLWKCGHCGDLVPNVYSLCPNCRWPVPKPEATKGDNINHPPHYNSHPSGIEQIDISQHWSFCLGNVLKYIWRCDFKGKPIEDLKKARFYLDREIQLRESKW